MKIEVVYLLHHVHEINDDEDVKLIGVYSTLEKAEKVLEEFKSVIGFKEYPEGFQINQHHLDETSWKDGFITIYE